MTVKRAPALLLNPFYKQITTLESLCQAAQNHKGKVRPRDIEAYSLKAGHASGGIRSSRLRFVRWSVRLQLMFFGYMPRTDMLPYYRYDTPKSIGVPRVDLLLMSKVVELGVQIAGYRS